MTGSRLTLSRVTEAALDMLLSSRRTIAILLLGISLVTALVPLNPLFPVIGLDPSWMYALNEASGLHLAFGSEIISTFGPYAALFTHVYDPRIDTLIIGASLLLSGLYLIVMCATFRNNGNVGYVLAASFFALAAMDRNTLFFAFPLFLALAIYRLTSAREETRCTHSSSLKLCTVVVAGAMGSGLLCLSKGSMIPYSWLMLALCAVLLTHRKQAYPATLLLISYAIAISLFWMISGQSLIDVPAYFASTLEVISGYTDGMSSQGSPLECIGYIAISLLTLLLLWIEHSGANRLFLGLASAIFYFFSFKAGFTRHDGFACDGISMLRPGHVGTAAWGLLLIGVCAPAIFKSYARQWISCLLGQLGCTLLIDSYGPANPAAAIHQLQATQNFALEGARARLGMGVITQPPITRYLRHNTLVRNHLDIDGHEGTWDLYSYDQAFLLAHDVQWNPRPAFQSYFAYTPRLLQTNADHLRGAEAPDNIVFKVQTIDYRYPTLDDGLSWPYLMGLYAPAKRLNHDFLLLERRAVDDPQRKVVLPNYSPARIVRLGQRVEVPSGTDLRYARLHFSKTLVGKAMSAAYKTPILMIRVELANGHKANYRLIPGITEAGFLLSPAIDSSEKFAFAAIGKMDVLRPFQVVAFTLLAGENGNLAWHDEVEFSLSGSG